MASISTRGVNVARKALTRHASIDATAIRYHKQGYPTSVLKVEKFKLDTSGLKANEVIVKMVAAPITPLDLAHISGYASKLAGPRVGGNEGIGIVEEAGSNSSLKKGDMVAACRPGVGTWSTHVIAPADSFTKVVLGSGQPIEAVAASVVPVLVAQQLLAMASLNSGETIVQNNASSTVGQAVVQLAASKGLKSINIMAPHSKWAEMVSHMQSIGATTVVSDEQAGRFEFATKVLADLPAGKLGLNSAGGAAASAVARALAPSSTLVTYGSATGRPVSAPLHWFTGTDLTLKGFSVGRYMAGLAKADLDKAVQGAVSSVSSGALTLLVAREPFVDFPIALKRAMTPEERKIVLNF